MTKKKLTQLGRYRIRGELGRGAMGVVYRADDPALDRTVALKVINLSDDAEGRTEYRARFLREAKAAGSLTHPHIITIHDFGEEDDLAYMAMELLKGTELRARMQQGAIPVREAIDIAAQVAEGLGYAHEHGVIHRDIKPSNIMLVARGQVKIMDFGVARMRLSDLKTSTGVVLGTPRYMSPEQVAGLPVDHRTDIFSLGIALYEMLTGSALFAGEDMPQIMHKVSKLEQVPPSRVNPQVPPMLDFILARALKKDPDVRYQDTYELAADLRSCLTELGDGIKTAKPDDGGSTRTIKLDTGTAKSMHIAPAAGTIVSDTLLPLSLRFDSSAAVQRLTSPKKRDQARLARTPRPVGIWRRLTLDPRRRRLFAVVVAAALFGAFIAFA